MPMTNRPRVVVAGALGKMGKAAVDTFIEHSKEFELVAGIVRDLGNVDPKIISELDKHGVTLYDNLADVLHRGNVDILVELTTPDSVYENSKLALANGVRPVIGATGLSDEDINELSKLCDKNHVGGIIAPNFAIGAILMMKFAAEAAKYMNRYEIIELHHDKKIDSPSGTAIKTAKLISLNAKGENKAGGLYTKSLSEKLPDARLARTEEAELTNASMMTPKGERNNADGTLQTGSKARGDIHYGVPIHSIRLQGFVASQEVIFGGLGQTLTIKHDTIDRSSFMPGILIACEKVMKLNKLVYGLENLL